MNLLTILLDGAQGIIIFPLAFFAHVLTTIFIEGGLLAAFKFEPWPASIRTALVVNALSLVGGIIVCLLFRGVAGEQELVAIYFIETICVEGVLLWWMNKEYSKKKLIAVTLLMNIITYITLYFALRWVD